MPSAATKLSTGRILRFVAVAFVLYVALLLPWRYGVEAYVHALVAPAQALTGLVDDHVRVDTKDHFVRHVRHYPSKRVPALQDKLSNPVFTSWLSDLMPEHIPHMWSQNKTRPFVLVETRDTFRLTLELPLFLALVLALPAIPWRRRIFPALIGLATLFVVHLLLLFSVGIWFHVRVGQWVEPRPFALDTTAPQFWNDIVNRYQLTGPVFALILFVALLFLGAFETRKKKA